MQVIGAGLGRTGTNSLKLALEMLLNGPCYHMFELWQHPEDVSIWQSAVDGNSIDWRNFLKPWKATVDWPGAPLFDRMAEAFPDALVLLSTRDPESWYESINSTIFMIMRKASEDIAGSKSKASAIFFIFSFSQLCSIRYFLNSSFLNTSFPIILIFSIFALFPSSTVILISILFLGFFISSISTSAPYLPFEA